MKTFYFLYDRKSPRHKWQLVSISEGIIRHCTMFGIQVADTETWRKQNNWTEYQLGEIAIEAEYFNDIPVNDVVRREPLPANDKRVKIIYPNQH